jgi:hypothetical protein
MISVPFINEIESFNVLRRPPYMLDRDNIQSRLEGLVPNKSLCLLAFETF